MSCDDCKLNRAKPDTAAKAGTGLDALKKLAYIMYLTKFEFASSMAWNPEPHQMSRKTFGDVLQFHTRSPK